MSRWAWALVLASCADEAVVLAPPPFCGDGVVSLGEACDQGPANSDTAPNACRTSCAVARCGDGVADDGEACDDGALDGRYGGCNPGCTLSAYCGDGSLDPEEACDDGPGNADRPGACRTTCVLPACDDGVLDPDEACIGRTFYTDWDFHDADGDGLADALVETPTSLALLVNRGDGTFEEAWVVTTTLTLDYWGYLDVTGDGIDDAVGISEWILVHRGAGDGTFAPPVRSHFPDLLSGFVGFADVDGDGVADLVDEDGIEGTRIRIAINDGSGRFVETQQLRRSGGPFWWFAELIDVDGGPLDITADREFWARGLGGGRFEAMELLDSRRLYPFIEPIQLEARTAFLGYTDAGSVPLRYEGGGLVELGPAIEGREVIHDFDADGSDEVAVRRGAEIAILGLPDGRELGRRAIRSGDVGAWSGDGGPGLVVKSGVELDVHAVSPSFAIGEPSHLSLDTYLDPTTLDRDDLQDFSGYFGHMMRGLHASTAIAKLMSYQFPLSIALADVDGGGLDVVAIAAPEQLVWMRGDGGAFGDAIQILPSASTFAVEDWNGDGMPDLVVASTEIAVLVNLGGTFARERGAPIPGPITEIAAGDLVGGSETDVAVATDRAVHILAGPSLTSIGRIDLSTAPTAMTIADPNDDGLSELYVVDEASSMLRAYAGATLLSEVATSSSPRDITGADVDGDGRSDLVIPCAAGVVEIRFGSGGIVLVPMMFRPTEVRAADVDGDGDSDLIVLVRDEPRWARGEEDYDSYVVVAVNRGGAFTTARPFATRGLARSFDAGDADGDGALDVVAATRASRYYSGPAEAALVTYRAHP